VKVKVTAYPYGQAVTAEHDDLDAVVEFMKGFLSLHAPGSRVDIDLQITT
jgi:hypothetical protein